MIFQATAVKSTTFYNLLTTYVNFGLAPNGDIGSHSLPQIYTFLKSSKTNYCAINVGLEVQNMNHIKRGQYLSLKPPKKSVILDVYTGHRALIQLRYYKFLSANNRVTMIKVLMTCLTCIKAL